MSFVSLKTGIPWSWHNMPVCHPCLAVARSMPSFTGLPKWLLTSKYLRPLGTEFVWPKSPGLSRHCFSLLAQTCHSLFESSFRKPHWVWAVSTYCLVMLWLDWGGLEKCVTSHFQSFPCSCSWGATAIFIYSRKHVVNSTLLSLSAGVN